MSRAIASQRLCRVTLEARGDSYSCLGLVQCKIPATLLSFQPRGVQHHHLPPQPPSSSLFWDQSQSWSFKKEGISAAGMLRRCSFLPFPTSPSFFTITNTRTRIHLIHGVLLPSAGCTPQCKVPRLQNQSKPRSQLGSHGRGTFISPLV